MASVKGVRSVEMEVAHVERAAQFYTRVWGLAEVERRSGYVYLRGTGRYHHILALHPARGAPSFRRMTFDNRSAWWMLRSADRGQGKRCLTRHLVRGVVRPSGAVPPSPSV